MTDNTTFNDALNDLRELDLSVDATDEEQGYEILKRMRMRCNGCESLIGPDLVPYHEFEPDDNRFELEIGPNEMLWRFDCNQSWAFEMVVVNLYDGSVRTIDPDNHSGIDIMR